MRSTGTARFVQVSELLNFVEWGSSGELNLIEEALPDIGAEETTVEQLVASTSVELPKGPSSQGVSSKGKYTWV